MKNLILIILSFLSLTVNSQQVIKLCDDIDNTFTYTTQSNLNGTFYWTVNGTLMTSNTENLIIDWQNYNLGSYDVEVNFTSDDGCTAIPFSYTVDLIECDYSTLYTPNSFTPDRDNINDDWGPSGFKVKEINIMVFNRWGELIFESNDLNNKWDGTHKNIPSPEDVYVYKITWTDNRNKETILTGRITLLR